MIWAIIKFNFVGQHCWKSAPEEVDFLRNPHRHVFYCEVYVEQKPGIDREVEYLQLKERLQEQIIFHPYITDSCEDIALNIQKFISEILPERKTRIYVYEDNENGCLIE